MSTEIILILALNLIIAGAVLYSIFVSRKKTDAKDDIGLQLLQNQLNQLTQSQSQQLQKLAESMQEQRKEVGDQLFRTQSTLQKQLEISQREQREVAQGAQKAIKDVTSELTKIGETNKQVVGFAQQLQSLENLLKNPKQRGILGEYFLETVLKNVLPPENFHMQYKFLNGEIVDALIVTREGGIPVDAKFSLSNYENILKSESESERAEYEKLFKKDLQNRIDETSKYIRPGETPIKTLDFAFMFIPADGLYYDLLVQKVGVGSVNTTSLIEYAFQKRVIIVSPTTLFAYLQTVLQGLKALKIEKSAEQIRQNVEKLQRHIKTYEDYFGKVGKHLGTTVGAYNDATKELSKVDKDILRITGDETLALQLDVDVDKPSGE